MVYTSSRWRLAGKCTNDSHGINGAIEITNIIPAMLMPKTKATVLDRIFLAPLTSPFAIAIDIALAETLPKPILANVNQEGREEITSQSP